jgi:hypothetical protein
MAICQGILTTHSHAARERGQPHHHLGHACTWLVSYQRLPISSSCPVVLVFVVACFFSKRRLRPSLCIEKMNTGFISSLRMSMCVFTATWTPSVPFSCSSVLSWPSVEAFIYSADLSTSNMKKSSLWLSISIEKATICFHPQRAGLSLRTFGTS